MFKVGDKVVYVPKPHIYPHIQPAMLGKVWEVYEADDNYISIKNCPTGIDRWDVILFQHTSKLHRILE